MPGITDQFADDFMTHAVNLSRFTEHTRRRVVSLFELLARDLQETINRFDVAGVEREAYRRKRTEALLARANETIALAYGAAEVRATGILVDLAKAEAEFLNYASLRAFGTEGVFRAGLTTTEARQLVKSTTVLGGPAKEYWRDQSQRTKRAFARQVRLGVTAGETNQELVSRVLGKATGRRLTVEDAKGKKRVVREYSGGALDTSRRNANALVRTSVQNVSNSTLWDTYKRNDDILKGIQAIVTLDGRTTLICIARSGGAWDFEGNPLEGSPYDGKFPGPPPWHFNCRSTILPLTKSWDDLINEETGKPYKKRLDSVPDSKRASVDGQVAGDVLYPDWLKTRTKAQQIDILGPGRWELWNEGKLSLSQLLDNSGRPLSLAALRARAR